MIRRRAESIKSSTAFQDLLFLLLSGVTILWVLSFLLINPVAKQADIITPAQIMITMDWGKNSEDDIDLWLRTPNGNIIYFGSKDKGGANLERDDLGIVSDCIQRPNFTKECIYVNREVIMLRGLQVGEYQLKFVVYANRLDGLGNPVTIEIIDLNPYKVEFSQDFSYSVPKSSISIIRFTVNADGDIESFSTVPVDFDINRNTNAAGQANPPNLFD